MRTSPRLAFASVAFLFATAAHAQAPPHRPDLTRARALDHEGARLFQEARYNEAIRYFEEAYKLGAPSTELWNIARCHLKLDEPEQAALALEGYLVQRDLSARDRREAKAELDELGRRHSVLTVASSPSGAHVAVDGRRAPGSTPLSVDLPPGSHTVAIEREGYAPYVQGVEAKYGRSVIVDVPLDRSDNGDEGAAAGASTSSEGGVSSAAPAPRRFSATAELGVLWGKLGSLPAPAHPVGLLALAYAVHDDERAWVALGVRAMVTEDTWGNGAGAPAPTTCLVPQEEYATAYGVFLDGAVGYRITRRARLGGDLGVGLADYLATQVGGDVFTPSCHAGTGLRPALHAGLEISYGLTRGVRALASPLVFEIQPAFGGTRTAAPDASGPWLRMGMAAGLAVDL